MGRFGYISGMNLLLTFLPNVFNPRWWQRSKLEFQLAWKLLRDPEVPRLLKLIPLVVLLYVLSPFDIIPGFLPVVGQLDDIGIMLLGLKLFARLAPEPIAQKYAESLKIDYMLKK